MLVLGFWVFLFTSAGKELLSSSLLPKIGIVERKCVIEVALFLMSSYILQLNKGLE